MITLKPIGSVELPPERLNKLPPVFKEIIEHQRDIDDYVSRRTVDVRAIKNLFDHRNYLARWAHRQWCSADESSGGPRYR